MSEANTGDSTAILNTAFFVKLCLKLEILFKLLVFCERKKPVDPYVVSGTVTLKLFSCFLWTVTGALIITFDRRWITERCAHEYCCL